MINIFGNFIGSSEGVIGESLADQLVFDDEVITFASADIRIDTSGIGNQLLQNHCIYKNGHTYLLGRMNWSNLQSRTFILPYFDGIGLDRPHMVHDGVGVDSHARPSGIMVGNKIHLVQEHPHDTSLYIYKANNENDPYSFKKQVEEIGVSCSYAELFELQDGRFVTYGQGVSSAKSAINIGDSGFANWGADTVFAESVSVTNYPATPLNYSHSVDGWRYFTINDRQSGVPPLGWRKKYLVKTKDFDTLYNFTETFSKTFSVNGQITAAELNANFLYYNLGTLDGLLPICALDSDENFYSVSYDGVSEHVFIHWIQGQSAPTVVPITGITNMVFASGNLSQLPAVALIIPFSSSDIRIFVRRNPDTYAKIYQYKTTDLGQTWTDLGDALPGINSNIGLFTTVQNFADIPENNNFIFAATDLLTNLEDASNLYVRKAALGALQSESTPYVSPYTDGEINALSGLMRRYRAGSAYISRVGANVSALIDQSPVGANATGVGSPQYNSDDGEYISFNGTSQAFSLDTPADLLALGEGTIIAVVKKDTAVVPRASVLVASNSLTTADRIAFGINNSVSFNSSIIHENLGSEIDTSIFTTYGDDATGTTWNILIWQLSDGVVSTQWINGKKQGWNRVVSSGGTVNTRTGYFFNKQSNLNVVDIGRIKRSTTDVFYDFKFKDLMIFNRPLSFIEINGITKKLADEHSITLNSHFQ